MRIHVVRAHLVIFWFLIRSLRCVRELEHLKTRLDDLMAPVRKEEWSDVLEAWMSLSDLRSRLRGQRCKAVLKIIFADEELCKAVGMLIQLRDIACPEDPAAGLMKALKTAHRSGSATAHSDGKPTEWADDSQRAGLWLGEAPPDIHVEAENKKRMGGERRWPSEARVFVECCML